MLTEYESILPELSEKPTPWSRTEAQRIAERDGLGKLGESHWRLIDTLRQHFVQYGAIPPAQLACSANHMTPHCIEELFLSPQAARRISGLPEPGEEARLG